MTAPSGLSTVVDSHGLTRAYGRRQVLRGIDLRIEEGERIALLGPNGAGKTTLMKILVGLLDADNGSVDGPTGAAVGWVPQGGAIYARLTVRENLMLFARLLGLEGSPADIAREAARAAELEPWFDTLGMELSGGLRQRLNVAVGLLGDPRMLVLDEPTTGVDLVHRTAMFDVLRKRSNDGCSVLFSTHSLEDAATADRVVVIVGGRIVHDGTLDDIALIGEQHPNKNAGVDATSRGLLHLWASGEGDAS